MLGKRMQGAVAYAENLCASGHRVMAEFRRAMGLRDGHEHDRPLRA